MDKREQAIALVYALLFTALIVAIVFISTGCSFAKYEHLGPGEGEIHRAMAVSFLLWSRGEVILADGAGFDFEQDTSEQAIPMAEAIARGAVQGAMRPVPVP